MVRPRVGMLGLMAAVALAAINLSVMRSWEPARGDGDIPHYLYATGVLPMASVLIFVAMISVRELASRGRASPFAVGFLAAGGLAIFSFVTAASLDIKGLRDVGRGVLILAAPFLLRLFERPPIQTQIVVECGLVAVVFSTPQLLFGLLGGWLARRLGLTIRLDRQENGANETAREFARSPGEVDPSE